jgi:ring-1,2-phenylacetyl-CoA epoxidase subunit PaaC
MASPTSDPGFDASYAEWLLRLGDACLVLSHRLSEWVSKAPTMEEDVALGNIALDLLGSARTLLTRAGEVEGRDRDEDALAYLRDSGEYRNPLVCELPNGDFAVTMLRQFFVDAWLHELWPRLASTTSDVTVRGVAEKAVKENAYHLRHSSAWVVRLGDGTDESHRRMTAALDQLWPFTGELLTDDDVDREIAARGLGVLPSASADSWHERVAQVLTEATLPVLDRDAWMQSGGRQGRHTEHLGYLLAEMQVLQRAHPGATW